MTRVTTGLSFSVESYELGKVLKFEHPQSILSQRGAVKRHYRQQVVSGSTDLENLRVS